MVTSAALVAQLVAGKATRDALFLTQFDVTLLPPVMIGAAILSGVSVLVVSRALSAAGPARVLPAAFAASAILFVSAWALNVKSERAASIAVYAHIALFNLSIGSAFWSLVNERFDPHTAKRLVARIASAGTAGGVMGGLLAWAASTYRSAPAMLLLLAMLSALGLGSSLRFAWRAPRPAASPAEVSTSGLKVFAQTPYLRDVALLVTTAAATQALLDWLLNAHASQHFEGQELLRFFALFNVAVSVLSFLAQILLTRVMLDKHGLGGTIKAQSASVAAAALGSLIAPALLAVIVTRVVEQVTRSSLYRSAYELFYTPLPNAKKRPTKLLIDVGVDRIGTTLASGGLFVIASLGASLAARAQLELQTRLTLLCVLALNAAAIYIAIRLQRGYVAALAVSLRSGAIALADEDAQDLTTRTTLAETSALLDREKLLAQIEEFQARKSERPERALEGPLTPERAALLLNDPVFEVRAEIALALTKFARDAAQHIELDRELVLKAVRYELTAGRSSWPAMDQVPRGLAHVFALLGLALEPEPVAIAYRALRATEPGLRGTALEYLEVSLPPDIRELLVPLLGDVKAPPRRRRRGRLELADELLRSRV
jgi:AAA family ATP:ADP antiporter